MRSARALRYLKRVKNLTLLIAGLSILNALVSFHQWLPRYSFRAILKPSLDFSFLLIFMVLVSLLARKKKLLLISVPSIASAALFFFSLGEAVTRHLYMRRFAPAVDLPYFLEFIRLLFDAQTRAASALATSLFIAVFLLFVAGIYTLVRGILRLLRPQNLPLSFAACLAALSLAASLAPAPTLAVKTSLLFSARGTTAAHTAGAKGGAEAIQPESGAFMGAAGLPRREGGPEKREPSSPLPEGRETHGHRSNVLLFFIESYGYTAYGNKEHFELLEPLLTRVEKNLTDSGYAIYSDFLKSPVIGGYSWYAESSFLTGMLINSKEKYKRLFETGARSMYTLMRERGYTTVLSAPGTIQPWPEGKALYGFDLFFTNTDFLYRGPHFSFVPVPDQYALFTIHKKVIENRAQDLVSRAPLFVVYMLVSSHAPFNRIPPYIADWDLLGDGAIYNDAPMLNFKNNWFSGEEYTEGYTAAVGYVLTVFSEYITRFVRDETLVVVVGDHQPKFPVTGSDEPWSVPIHVLGKREPALTPLEHAGFTAGLIPRQDPPHRGLETFYPLFEKLVDGL